MTFIILIGITIVFVIGLISGYFIARREFVPKKNDKTTRFKWNGKDWMPE